MTSNFWATVFWTIPNGYFDAYEVKVNKDIFKYQEKVKLRLGAQSSYVVKYFEGSNAVKTTSMRYANSMQE